MDTTLKSENKLALTSHDDFHSFKVLTQICVRKMRRLIGRSLFRKSSYSGSLLFLKFKTKQPSKDKKSKPTVT